MEKTRKPKNSATQSKNTQQLEFVDLTAFYGKQISEDDVWNNINAIAGKELMPTAEEGIYFAIADTLKQKDHVIRGGGQNSKRQQINRRIYLSNIQEISKKAKYVGTENNSDFRNKKKKETVAFHYFESIVKINENFYKVKLAAAEYTQQEIERLKKIGKLPLSTVSSETSNLQNIWLSSPNAYSISHGKKMSSKVPSVLYLYNIKEQSLGRNYLNQIQEKITPERNQGQEKYITQKEKKNMSEMMGAKDKTVAAVIICPTNWTKKGKPTYIDSNLDCGNNGYAALYYNKKYDGKEFIAKSSTYFLTNKQIFQFNSIEDFAKANGVNIISKQDNLPIGTYSYASTVLSDSNPNVSIIGLEMPIEKLTNMKVEGRWGYVSGNKSIMMNAKETLEMLSNRVITGLNPEKPFDTKISENQNSNRWIPYHNAKLLKEAMDNGTAPFLPNEQGVIEGKPIYNGNTGYVVGLKDLVALQIVKDQNGYASDIAVTKNIAEKAHTSIKQGEKGFFYNFKREDGTYGTSQFFFTEQMEQPERIDEWAQGHKTLQNNINMKPAPQKIEMSIDSADPEIFLGMYYAKCKRPNDVTLSCSKEIADEFKKNLDVVLQNTFAKSDAYSEEIGKMNGLLYNAGVKSNDIIKQIDKETGRTAQCEQAKAEWQKKQQKREMEW